MKQKLLQVRKLRMRWRLLAILFVVLGVMVPTALANHDVWWGSWHGDFRGTQQRNNYIIHPPSDQMPQSRPGGSSQDGARLSFVMHRPAAQAGTSIAYLPNQYLVSSTTPNLKFEMRGGHWSPNNAGGQDRYDRDLANVDGIVDLVKKRGFMSPVYYEVYQLKNGGTRDGMAQGGRFLGIINPRDRNIFPTTDNQPNSNDNCKYTNGASGPCWRTFSIGTGGGNITLNGAAQDSCEGRIGGSSPCFDVHRNTDQEHRHYHWSLWGVEYCCAREHVHTNAQGTKLAYSPHSHHNPGSNTGDESQLFRNNDAHTQFNTNKDNYKGSGNYFWEWGSHAPDGEFNHTHQLFYGNYEQRFRHKEYDNYAGDHTHPDGSGKIAAAPSELFPGYYVLGVNKLQYYNRSGGDYQDGGNYFRGWRGDFPSGEKNHTHSRYYYDRKSSDAGAMSAAYFNGVDPGTRFDSSAYPNLNGNYVFLIKAVNFQDRFNGYVADYNTIKQTGDDKGCVQGAGSNQVSCPTILLNYAKNRGIDGPLVQDGYYLRTPKDLAGGRQHLASAPNRVAFNVNYGPVTGAGNPGQEHEYEEMAGQTYRGLRFQTGGAGCRNDGFSQRPGKPDYLTGFPFFGVGNADWDNSAFNYGGFEGPPPSSPNYDHDIHASISRLGTSDDYGTLTSNPQGPKNVAVGTISGSWQDYPGFAISLDNPGGPGGFGGGGGVFQPYWYKNEQYAGDVSISGWNDGNNIAQGGAPFTWGYWPTCLRDGTGGEDEFKVTAHTPKSIFNSYKYNGRDTFNQTNNANDAVVDFAFQYTLPETRGQVKYYVVVNRASDGAQMARSDQTADNVGPGPHQVRFPIQTNSFEKNTNYTWKACVDPGPQPAPGTCTSPITFQVNKGPTAEVVSGDPDYNTNTGNVNYNCSKLAVKLTDPEAGTTSGSQVRPYFAVSWTKDGKTNVVTSFNRGGLNSDSWGKWVNSSGSATNGYKASGSTFTSDEVKPVTWTVTSPTGSVTSKSVPNKTLTQFLQQDVPEGADVNWTASGEDRYGASDVGTSASDTFYSLFSTPRATHHASSLGDVTKQVSMNYRRFGAPTGAGFHKNTRPNLLPPGSTKKFFDLNGAVTEDITDGQLVRVETKLKNTGETPTKKYEIYDYLGSIRDFEPPITTSSDLPITVQYNDGAERAVEPLISRVIPNRSNGNLDQVENVISSDDDRRASYKLDFGTNPDQAANVSVTKNGKDYSSCSYASTGLYCATDYAAYPNSVYFYCGFDGRWVGGCNGGYDASAVWSYRLDGAPTGTYDLTLSYYNRPNPDYPPPNYGSYHVKVDYPGGSRTVNLPIESNSQANGLHTFVLQGLDITGANPTVTLTWDNDAWNPGDANFGLNSLRLATAEDDTSDSILRRGQLNPGETVALRYYVRANRNRTTTDDSDPNNNFQRRLKVGSATGPIVPQPDPKGGTVDVGDAHVFVPYSEDYCNRSNPLLNHTCEFEPGDVLAPWLRGQRGSIASNEGIFGYDPLAGEENATFLVQANGVLSHFSGGAGNLGGYQAAPATCAPSGDLDWRKEMYKNIQKLVAGDTHNMGSTVPAVMNLESGGNVWYRDGDLTLPARPDPARFRGVGTIVVKGNLTIEGEMAYDTNNTAINSLGIIVLGNINVKDSVTKMVGTYYVSDIDRDLAGQSNGCPVVDAANGVFTTGSSKTRLDVRGALVARQFNFQRYFVDPSDSVADPAENVYYDGRVVANTPPGFGVFRDTASWYEIAP